MEARGRIHRRKLRHTLVDLVDSEIHYDNFRLLTYYFYYYAYFKLQALSPVKVKQSVEVEVEVQV